jgi:hypothetical protein
MATSQSHTNNSPTHLPLSGYIFGPMLYKKMTAPLLATSYQKMAEIDFYFYNARGYINRFKFFW